MLTVENVMKLLVCSRSSAYEQMNRALGRRERTGCLLRVPLDIFEGYVANTLQLAAPRSAEQTRAPAAPGALSSRAAAQSGPSDIPVIRVARPPRPRR